MIKRIYLSGPMSGIPYFNYPAFDEAERRLTARGHIIISPARLDTPEVRERAMASLDGVVTPDLPSWGTMLARDVRIVIDDCNAVALLPGWQKSRGATLETYAAMKAGHMLYYYDGRMDFANLIPVTHAEVRAFL